MQYKLTEKKLIEDGTYKDQIIEKHGYVPTFTLAQLEENITYAKQKIKETKAMADYESAKAENIEHHHPFVKDLEDFERFTIHAYTEALGMKKAATRKLEELQAQLDEDEAEMKAILEQIPELDVQPSPYVAPENPAGETVDETPEAPADVEPSAGE